MSATTTAICSHKDNPSSKKHEQAEHSIISNCSKIGMMYVSMYATFLEKVSSAESFYLYAIIVLVAVTSRFYYLYVIIIFVNMLMFLVRYFYFQFLSQI